MSRNVDQPSALAFIGGVLATLLFHGAMVVGYIYLHEGRVEAAQDDSSLMEFEAVELLMWGEVMPDPGELPIIANPELDTQPEDVVDPTPPDEEVVLVEPDEREIRRDDPEDNPDQRRDNELHNPDRPTNNEQIQGSPDGFRGGTSLSASALENLFGPAQRQIQRAFHPPSSLGDSELERLRGLIRFRTNAAGRIMNWEWITHSGNATFDSAVERALNRFRHGSERLRLPIGNDEAMRFATEVGIAMEIAPN
jgi:outer membrane biosynthesis protein TonB